MNAHPEAAEEVLHGEVDLATCSPAYWAVFMRGHVDGYMRGHRDAVAEQDAAEDALWAEATRRVHAVASSPSFAVLCDRRGDPERAKRARAHEQWMVPIDRADDVIARCEHHLRMTVTVATVDR